MAITTIGKQRRRGETKRMIISLVREYEEVSTNDIARWAKINQRGAFAHLQRLRDCNIIQSKIEKGLVTWYYRNRGL